MLEGAVEADADSTDPGTQRLLFVDLDGTLIKTDLLYEAALAAAKQHPRSLLVFLKAIVSGRAAFKQAVASVISPDIRRLPFREEVLDLIAAAREEGTKIVLATASDARWARMVAEELGIFDDVLSSDGRRNLKGGAKLEAIRDYCLRHGISEFDYVGDCRADLPIWREARRAYAVGASAALLSEMRSFGEPIELGCRAPHLLNGIGKLLRPHQWAKNLLVFVPLIMSHQIFALAPLLATLTAFGCFCACASAVYVINDLLDLDADRLHPTKRKRPFAAGTLPVRYGPPLAMGLCSLGLLVSAGVLPAAFTLVLALYFITSCAYSLVLKRIVMLDVVALACLYVVRVLGGGLAAAIPVSEWLMAFSLFMFASLAFAKRYAELGRLAETSESATPGRGYRVNDLALIESMGPTCGLLSVLVLALYIQSEQMQRLYTQPWALWLLCPLLLYWVSRLWIKAKRNELCDDPVVFALRDRLSVLMAGLSGLLLALAAWK